MKAMLATLVFVVLASLAWPQSPEICAKVREARKRQVYYEEMQVSHGRLEVNATKLALLYTKQGYSTRQVEARMADTYRAMEESRRRVEQARADYQRLADDLIGKVPEPWPACGE